MEFLILFGNAIAFVNFFLLMSIYRLMFLHEDAKFSEYPAAEGTACVDWMTVLHIHLISIFFSDLHWSSKYLFSKFSAITVTSVNIRNQRFAVVLRNPATPIRRQKIP